MRSPAVASTSPSDGQQGSSDTANRSPTEGSSSATDDDLGDVLFEDDFSNMHHHWTERVPPGASSKGLHARYEDGGFVMEAAKGSKAVFTLPAPIRASTDHVVVEADMIHTGRHAIYGVYCKANARQTSMYVFTLESTGSWAVAELIDTDLRVLGTGTDPTIEPGAAVNHLRADCFEKEPPPDPVAGLRFWVNGKPVFEGRDRSGLSGPEQSLPGLFLETDFEGDARVVFDNFVFWGVDPAS